MVWLQGKSRLPKIKKDFLCQKHKHEHYKLCLEGDCKDRLLTKQVQTVNITQHLTLVNGSRETHDHSGTAGCYLNELVDLEQGSGDAMPSIIYYDSLASCSLVDMDGSQATSVDQGPEIFEQTRFEGCNSTEVDDLRLLKLKLFTKSGSIDIQSYLKQWPAPHSGCPNSRIRAKLAPQAGAPTCEGWEGMPKILLGINYTRHFPITLSASQLPKNWEVNYPELRVYCSLITFKPIYQGFIQNDQTQVSTNELKILSGVCEKIKFEHLRPGNTRVPFLGPDNTPAVSFETPLASFPLENVIACINKKNM